MNSRQLFWVTQKIICGLLYQTFPLTIDQKFTKLKKSNIKVKISTKYVDIWLWYTIAKLNLLTFHLTL